MSYQALKRLIDLIVSALCLILLAPVFLVLIVLIKWDTPGPAFFKQNRAGRRKAAFQILKFRTMRVDAPSDMPTWLLNNPDRYITRAGRFLRRTSLDELPQIINILMGQMSFVGPRPVLFKEKALINERDKYGANDVMPGLTGWAQVNGRDELPFEIKARLDGEYVDRRSLLFDAKCIFLTIACVLNGAGFIEGRREGAGFAEGRREGMAGVKQIALEPVGKAQVNSIREGA